MPITPISDLYSLGGYIRSISDSSALKRVSELAFLANSTEKISSEDKKDNFVSTQIDDNKSAVSYDFRFQPNVPLARPLETGKTFNETQKTNKKETDKKTFTDLSEETESDDESPVRDLTGQGYYIVINDQSPPPERNVSVTPEELWRDRINATYRLNRFRSNGTLVNLTA